MLPFTRWTCWISKRPVCPSPRPSVSGFVCQRVCLTKYGNNEFRGQYPSSICGISSEDDGDRYHVPLSPVRNLHETSRSSTLDNGFAGV